MNNNTTSTTAVPELLAPAGDWEMLKAAVANGADAVYFGLQDFNARRRAENFSLERLAEVMEFLRNRNVRGYVAFNTLIFPGELPRAEQFALGIARAGADAVIVQDVGLMRLIQQVAPTLPIHASTQATQTHPAGLAMLAGLGVERAILARELTLEQIAACRSAGMDVETFVHGALCISYSGQCLASAYLWGRSANRGQCGQACRLPYRLCRSTGVPPVRLEGFQPSRALDNGQDSPAGTSTATGGTPVPREYPISPLDLNGGAALPALARAGVCAVKIEGRLKGPHYVAAVVQVYRAALDALAAGQPFAPTEVHRRQLATTFSRGFTEGFLRSESAPVVAGDFSARRGVFVGTVVDFDYDGVVVELAPGCELGPVKPGDGLAFGDGEAEQGGHVYDVKPWRMPPEFLKRSRRAADPRRGDAAHRSTGVSPVSRMGVPPMQPHPEGETSSLRHDQHGLEARATHGRDARATVGRVEFVRLGFGRNDLDVKKIRFGDSVWKTADPAVMKTLETSWSRDVVARPAAVDFTVTAAVGGPLTLHARERAGGFEARADWPGPCERAEKHPLTAETAATQLARLGDSPFTLGTVTLRENVAWASRPCVSRASSPRVDEPSMPREGETPSRRMGGTPMPRTDAGGTPAPRGDAVDALAILAPRSVLNDLRRQVVESLQAQRHAAARHAIADEHALQTLRSTVSAPPASLANDASCAGQARVSAPVALHVLVRSADTLDAVLAWSGPAGDVILDAGDWDALRTMAARCRRAGREFALATPRILKPGDERAMVRLLDEKPASWRVRNLAALAWLRENTAAALVGDYSLNAANDLATAWLLRAGLERVTPSYDLACPHVEELLRQADPSRLEIVVHQHMPMLHMQYDAQRGTGVSPVSHMGFQPVQTSPGGQDELNGKTQKDTQITNLPSPEPLHGRDAHATHGRDARATLEDRNGQLHPVWRDLLGRTTVFGSYVQTAMPYVPTLRSAGVEHVRVELLDEQADHVHATLDLYAAVLSGHANVSDAWPRLKELGPVTRGTWAEKQDRGK